MSTTPGFGWSYPAGAEFDPRAPWNESPEPPEVEDCKAGESLTCPCCSDIVPWYEIETFSKARWQPYTITAKLAPNGWYCDNCGWKQIAIPEDYNE